MSRFFTSSAFSSMNLRRDSTSSPIRVEKMFSVSAMSSSFTESKVPSRNSPDAWNRRFAQERSQLRKALRMLLFFFLEVFKYSGQIKIEFCRVGLAGRPNLIHDFIMYVHARQPLNSSGVQTTGRSQPLLLASIRAGRWISAFARCLQ